jgi:hypothetical protein
MSKENLLINIADVNSFLLDDTRCSKEQKEEIIGTLWGINQIKGRNWVFSHDWKEYIIDEYNEHNDFIKTYTFKV